MTIEYWTLINPAQPYHATNNVPVRIQRWRIGNAHNNANHNLGAPNTRFFDLPIHRRVDLYEVQQEILAEDVNDGEYQNKMHRGPNGFY